MESRSRLINAALDEVARLRASNFQGNDVALVRLLHEYGETSDLANQLWDDLSTELRSRRRRDISDLLGLWMWRTNDNGSRILAAQEEWLLACDDEDKVWVALHRDGVPFAERGDLLARAAVAFPNLESVCREALQTR